MIRLDKEGSRRAESATAITSNIKVLWAQACPHETEGGFAV